MKKQITFALLLIIALANCCSEDDPAWYEERKGVCRYEIVGVQSGIFAMSPYSSGFTYTNDNFYDIFYGYGKTLGIDLDNSIYIKVPDYFNFSDDGYISGSIDNRNFSRYGTSGKIDLTKKTYNRIYGEFDVDIRYNYSIYRIKGTFEGAYE